MGRRVTITAAELEALRHRHADLERRRSEAVGRRDALQAQLASLGTRMAEEYGVEDLDGLRALLVAEREALDAAYAEAERAIAAAEEGTTGAGR